VTASVELMPEAVGLRLPRIDIDIPRNPSRVLWATYVTLVLVVIAVRISLQHHDALQVYESVGIGIILLVPAVTLAGGFAILAARQRARRQDLPSDVIYRGSALSAAYADRRGLLGAGTLEISASGVRFAPTGDGAPWLTLAWNDISRLELSPADKIGLGQLTISLFRGDSRVFSVPEYRGLASTLRGWAGREAPLTNLTVTRTMKPAIALVRLLPFAVVIGGLAFHFLYHDGPRFSYRVLASQLHLTDGDRLVVPFTITNTGNDTGSPWCVAFSETSPNNAVADTNFTDMTAIKPNQTKTLSLTVPSQVSNGINMGNPRFVQLTCDASLVDLKNETAGVTTALPAHITKSYANLPPPVGNS